MALLSNPSLSRTHDGLCVQLFLSRFLRRRSGCFLTPCAGPGLFNLFVSLQICDRDVQREAGMDFASQISTMYRAISVVKYIISDDHGNTFGHTFGFIRKRFLLGQLMYSDEQMALLRRPA